MCCFIAHPPAITAIDITETCTNDFTISWTAASNEEGLSYTVTLSSPSMMNDTVVDAMMNTLYNFTDLMPNIPYEISIFSKDNKCSGIPNELLVTTLMEGTGEPQGELHYCCEYVPLKLQGRHFKINVIFDGVIILSANKSIIAHGFTYFTVSISGAYTV